MIYRYYLSMQLITKTIIETMEECLTNFISLYSESHSVNFRSEISFTCSYYFIYVLPSD